MNSFYFLNPVCPNFISIWRVFRKIEVRIFEANLDLFRVDANFSVKLEDNVKILNLWTAFPAIIYIFSTMKRYIQNCLIAGIVHGIVSLVKKRARCTFYLQE